MTTWKHMRANAVLAIARLLSVNIKIREAYWIGAGRPIHNSGCSE